MIENVLVMIFLKLQTKIKAKSIVAQGISRCKNTLATENINTPKNIILLLVFERGVIALAFGNITIFEY